VGPGSRPGRQAKQLLSLTSPGRTLSGIRAPVAASPAESAPVK